MNLSTLTESERPPDLGYGWYARFPDTRLTLSQRKVIDTAIIITGMRKAIVLLFVLILGLGLATAGAYVAGRASGPVVAIASPARYIGLSTPLDVTIHAPQGRLSSLRVVLEHHGAEVTLVSGMESAGGWTVTADGPDRVRVAGTLGHESVPDLRSGPARISVTASRPVIFGLRDVASSAIRDVTVRLEPPRLAVLSTHHYVNLGGSEMIVYRVEPDDVRSGVTVGNLEYPGFPVSRRHGWGHHDRRFRHARGLLRASLRPGRERAHPPLRARRGRQRGDRRI